jgi:hypothetical protein
MSCCDPRNQDRQLQIEWELGVTVQRQKNEKMNDSELIG